MTASVWTVQATLTRQPGSLPTSALSLNKPTNKPPPESFLGIMENTDMKCGHNDTDKEETIHQTKTAFARPCRSVRLLFTDFSIEFGDCQECEALI